jgi:hypothetical protein
MAVPSDRSGESERPASPTIFIAPTHYPVGCPELPHDGRPGEYFRLVSRASGAPEEDFLPDPERPGYIPRKREGRGSQCKNCALSVFTTKESAELFVAQRGPTFAYRFPVRMHLHDAHGVVKSDERTWRGHFLWWLPLGRRYRDFAQEV